MKNLIFSLLISGISATVLAQTSTVPKFPIDSASKKITYTEVVQQTGIKDTLYNRAIHWCNIFFKNAQSVTTKRDKEDGIVEGKPKFKVFKAATSKDTTKIMAGFISFTFTIACKENRYKYTITDLNLKGVSYFPLERWLNKKDPAYSAECDNYLVQVDNYMQDLIKSIKKGMLEAVKKKDVW